MSGECGHAPAATAGAHRPGFATERNQALEVALAAFKTRKTSAEGATAEEVAKLLFHEARQAGAMGGAGSVVEECFEVRADDLVQNPCDGRARLVAQARGGSGSRRGVLRDGILVRRCRFRRHARYACGCRAESSREVPPARCQRSGEVCRAKGTLRDPAHVSGRRQCGRRRTDSMQLRTSRSIPLRPCSRVGPWSSRTAGVELFAGGCPARDVASRGSVPDDVGGVAVEVAEGVLPAVEDQRVHDLRVLPAPFPVELRAQDIERAVHWRAEE